MSTAGIVAEYNPFHNGHAYHIARTRENGASAVVCVMSSWFVQRGETALMHPNARAHMALMNGADLVVSLPVPWACAAAQTFARGAVGLLDAMGCVDTLSFGSECADIGLLRAASRAVDDYTVRESMRANLLSGVSFASARQRAVEELDPRVASVLSSPNDTLAVEYIRAIDTLKSELAPFAVRREGAGHDSGEAVNSFASASLIRSRVRAGEGFADLMPESAAEILKAEIEAGRAPADINVLEKAVLACLRISTPEKIATVPDISSVYSAPHGIIDGRARENRSAARSSIEEIRFARSPSFFISAARITIGSFALERMARSFSRPIALKPRTLIYGGMPSQSDASIPSRRAATARLIRAWE